MNTPTHPAPAGPSHPITALRAVICGVDGTARSDTAIEQASLLSCRGELTLLAVYHPDGDSPGAAVLGPHSATRVLRDALALARRHHVAARANMIAGVDPAEAILRQASNVDLIAVGAPRSGRATGIALDSTATGLLHESSRPILIARPVPSAAAFPGRVVLATDGSQASDRAIELTASIVASIGGEVMMVHAGGERSPDQRRRMTEQSARMTQVTGREPVWVSPGSAPAIGIVETARWNRASLIVLGARGARGLRALGSVSERVAHQAPCSVLVARG